jgi:hypothetical protein
MQFFNVPIAEATKLLGEHSRIQDRFLTGANYFLSSTASGYDPHCLTSQFLKRSKAAKA